MNSLDDLFDLLVDELGDGVDVAMLRNSGEIHFIDTTNFRTWMLTSVDVVVDK